jgi:hypothetical protein
MKVAYFAESPADQAALTIFTETILGKTTETISHAGLKHRGWPAVRTDDQLFTSRAPADQLGRYLSNRARNSFASAPNASAPVAEAS